MYLGWLPECCCSWVLDSVHSQGHQESNWAGHPWTHGQKKQSFKWKRKRVLCTSTNLEEYLDLPWSKLGGSHQSWVKPCSSSHRSKAGTGGQLGSTLQSSRQPWSCHHHLTSPYSGGYWSRCDAGLCISYSFALCNPGVIDGWGRA